MLKDVGAAAGAETDAALWLLTILLRENKSFGVGRGRRCNKKKKKKGPGGIKEGREPLIGTTRHGVATARC